MDDFDLWVADLEASFVLGMKDGISSRILPGVPAATTPLLLQIELESSFGFMLEHLSALLPHGNAPVMLLNTVYWTIEAVRPFSKAANIQFLLDIFVQSAAPMWAMLDNWLHLGMPIPNSLTTVDADYTTEDLDAERRLDAEFFVRRDRDVSWAEEDFWEAGFVDGPDGWPIWLAHGDTKEAVMECGKARGLLTSLAGRMEEGDAWLSLRQVVVPQPGSDPSAPAMRDIAESIAAYLGPVCQLTQFHLRQALDEECGLQEHLEAIEGFMYMQGFTVMNEWRRWLSNQVRWAR